MDQEVSPLVRIGLPIALAILAAALNTAAVHRQITPLRAYAFASNMAPGQQLTVDDLHEISISGNFNSDLLVTKELLMQDSDNLSLKECLSLSPQYVSSSSRAGELITLTRIGGNESVQPGANEELVGVPRSVVRGGGSRLLPGQTVYFLATSRDSDTPTEIGPFRVAREAVDPDGDRSQTIALIYRLDQQGKPPAGAETLRHAAVSTNQISLAILEKGRYLKRSPRTLTSQRARSATATTGH